MSKPWRIIEQDTQESNNIDIDRFLEEKQEKINEPQKQKSEDHYTSRMEIFVAEVPIRKFSNLIVSEATMNQILNILAKVRHHQFLYDNWNLKEVDPYGGRTAINLYGPPGTGKSFCAEAIASELHKRIIRVSYSEIESKYVGDTSKNIKAAFAKARKENALLFFDEADSILGRRLTNVTQSADHSVNVSRSVMLLELDHFDGITVFATNLASNYDSAFVRRILGHIEMPLPDIECRERLWKLHIPRGMDNTLQIPKDYQELAEFSEGLSGGDILNAVISAATIAVQRQGLEKCVKLEDLKTAINQTRKVKTEVGVSSTNINTDNLTRIPISKAPPDVQEKHQNIFPKDE